MNVMQQLATAARCLLRRPPAQQILLQGSSGRRSFATALSPDDRVAALTKLAREGSPFQWEEVEGRNAIKKTFAFGDFSQAWAFMSRTALLAEKMDHHPEWYNVYNTVDVTLTTHDSNGVSEKDIRMAEEMESFADDLLPRRL